MRMVNEIQLSSQSNSYATKDKCGSSISVLLRRLLLDKLLHEQKEKRAPPQLGSQYERTAYHYGSDKSDMMGKEKMADQLFFFKAAIMYGLGLDVWGRQERNP